MKRNIKILLVVLAVGIIAGPSLYEQLMAKLTQPVGEVCLEGQPCADAAPVVAASGPRSGADIYQTGCLACHTSGVAGAPRIGVKSDWNARAKKGLNTLTTNAYAGYGGMPAKGLCGDCSEDEIQAAVQYILDETKIKL